MSKWTGPLVALAGLGVGALGFFTSWRLHMELGVLLGVLGAFMAIAGFFIQRYWLDTNVPGGAGFDLVFPGWSKRLHEKRRQREDGSAQDGA